MIIIKYGRNRRVESDVCLEVGKGHAKPLRLNFEMYLPYFLPLSFPIKGIHTLADVQKTNPGCLHSVK